MKKRNANQSLVNLKDYSIVDNTPINRGAFGIIYLVENNSTHEKFAAKVNLQSGDSMSEQNKFITREISILIRLQGPTIIPFHGFSLTDFGGYPYVTILMKYIENGSLKHLIELESKSQSPHEYDNTAKQIILCGVAHGMMTLHFRRILHRDLKPDNVLIDSNYHPYITDFGLSKFLDPDNSKSQSMSGYTEELTKKKFNTYNFQTRIMNGDRPKMDCRIKESFQELIKRCWSSNVRERPTFQELFTKLSLSLDDDDESIESSINRILCGNPEGEEQEEEYNSRYCLDEVDIDQVLTYVEEINEYDREIDHSESKKIIELEEENRNYQQENQEIKKQNEKYQHTIDNLQMELKKMNDHNRQVNVLGKNAISYNEVEDELFQSADCAKLFEKPVLKFSEVKVVNIDTNEIDTYKFDPDKEITISDLKQKISIKKRQPIKSIALYILFTSVYTEYTVLRDTENVSVILNKFTDQNISMRILEPSKKKSSARFVERQAKALGMTLSHDEMMSIVVQSQNKPLIIQSTLEYYKQEQ